MLMNSLLMLIYIFVYLLNTYSISYYMILIRYLVGRSRQRIGVQLQEARENFANIAEKHAEALKVNIYIYYYYYYCMFMFFVNS